MKEDDKLNCYQEHDLVVVKWTQCLKENSESDTDNNPNTEWTKYGIVSETHITLYKSLISLIKTK